MAIRLSTQRTRWRRLSSCRRALLGGALSALLALGGCGAEPAGTSGTSTPEALTRLAGYMTGVFSSAKQAAAEEGYLDIRLATARIWRERTDAVWLYVEQAAAQALDRPYRQRVYRVQHVGADLYESKIFALPEPKEAIGVWEQEAPLAALNPDRLKPLAGCAVILRALDDGTFRGSTLGTGCGNSFADATYATSEVTVQAQALLSWDRGYDDTHTQVWGADKAGYIFEKVRDLTP